MFFYSLPEGDYHGMKVLVYQLLRQGRPHDPTRRLTRPGSYRPDGASLNRTQAVDGQAQAQKVPDG
jgi:hypothetical protein